MKIRNLIGVALSFAMLIAVAATAFAGPKYPVKDEREIADLSEYGDNSSYIDKEILKYHTTNVRIVFKGAGWGSDLDPLDLFVPGSVLTVYYDSPYDLEWTSLWWRIFIEAGQTISSPLFGIGWAQLGGNRLEFADDNKSFQMTFQTLLDSFSVDGEVITDNTDFDKWLRTLVFTVGDATVGEETGIGYDEPIGDLGPMIIKSITIGMIDESAAAPDPTQAPVTPTQAPTTTTPTNPTNGSFELLIIVCGAAIVISGVLMARRYGKSRG